MRFLQEPPAAGDGGAEVFHLREHDSIRVRHGLRVVHARDHVVETPCSENHLERRLLVGPVERDEPLRDHPLARLQVVLRDVQLATVLPQVALDLREPCVRGVVLRACALERVGELLQLTHDLLRLRALGRDRGVGERRDCRQES